MDVPLHVEQVDLPAEGNLQELARDARYALAEQLADGRLRRRPHRVRPGRDGAVPAGRLARLAGAARHGAPPRAAGAAAAGGDARGGARLPARAAGSSGARTPRTPTAASPAPASATTCSTRCASCRRRRSGRSPRPRASCATRPRCWTPRWRRRWRSWAAGPALSLDALREFTRRPPAARAALARRRGRSPARSSTRSWRVGDRGTEVARPRRRPAGGRRVRHAPLQPRRGRRASRRPSSSPCPAAPASATGSSRPAWVAPATWPSRTSAPR